MNKALYPFGLSRILSSFRSIGVDDSSEDQEEDVENEWVVEVGPVAAINDASNKELNVDSDGEKESEGASNDVGPKHTFLEEWMVDVRKTPDKANKIVPDHVSADHPVPCVLGPPIPSRFVYFAYRYIGWDEHVSSEATKQVDDAQSKPKGGA